MAKQLPARIYVCPVCKYTQEYRWVLARHLNSVHGVPKRKSKDLASQNEFFLNPMYVKRASIDEDDLGDYEDNND